MHQISIQASPRSVLLALPLPADVHHTVESPCTTMSIGITAFREDGDRFWKIET